MDSNKKKGEKDIENNKQNNKKEVIQLEGKVLEALPNATFKVELDSGQEILSHISGKMRMHHIRILEGDKVTVEMSPYDLTKGRIIYRHK